MSNNPNDSAGSTYDFVRVDSFTPNSYQGVELDCQGHQV